MILAEVWYFIRFWLGHAHNYHCWDQNVVPVPIRARFSLCPSQGLEWISEADASILVWPVDLSPVKAFRGMGRRGGSS